MISRLRSVLFTTLLSAILFLLPGAAHARSTPPPDRWVGTWGASPMALDTDAKGLGLTGAGPVPGATDTTFRLIVHTSLGGPLLRVVLTNEFGTDPLTIGEVHIALAAQGGAISLSSANALTFNGSPSITIPPGARVVSDPAALALPAFGDLAVSVFVPAQPLRTLSGHSFADQISYIASGNVVGKASLPGASEISTWPIVKGVEVMVPGTSGAVVCLGDSITDGTASTRGANLRWPDLLAHRLHNNKKTRELAIINEGIGGNRILRDGTGPSALARFDRDVLAQPSVRYLVILEGINDIGQAFNPSRPAQPITAELVIQAFAQLATRAHAHGIRVYVATITPYLGAGYSSPAGEQVRQAVNQWIRTSNLLDGFLEFDKATRDPGKPDTLSASADSGDHLHPSDAGYRQMADSIDLKLFAPIKETYDIVRDK